MGIWPLVCFGSLCIGWAVYCTTSGGTVTLVGVGTVLAGAGQPGGLVWGGFFSREEITCCLSSCFWLPVTPCVLSPVAAIACVTLLNESYMENHLSSDSILFWKTQGPSKWETLCTCSARNRNHMSWNSRCL